MPVNTPCEEYDRFIGKWIKCRTVVNGEEEVKMAGSAYLPYLLDQIPGEYEAYKNRALFYGATGRTVTGLLGAIFRKMPTIEGAEEEKIKDEFKSVTQDNQDVLDFASMTVVEVLVTGRVGILLDAPQNLEGVPYLAIYQSETIINWRYTDIEDGKELSMVVLEEKYEEDGDDEFTKETKKQYRVLELNLEGVYQQRLFRETFLTTGKAKGTSEYSEYLDEPIVPNVSGHSLDYIPFMFINHIDTSPIVYNSPILALANVNLSHYRSSADLEHGRHFTGLPTAWVAGFDEKTQLHIGSQVAWISEDPQANAGYLEFTGQGLGSLENALKEKQEMMAVLGARMLEDPKNPVESGVALSTRYRGENNVLSSISKTVSGALSTLLTWLLEWRGITKDITVELNKDFINDRLTSGEVKDLMETWQGGAISWETLFFNFKRGEIYPQDIDIEKEKTAIDTETELDIKSRMNDLPPNTEEVDGDLEEGLSDEEKKAKEEADALKKK